MILQPYNCDYYLYAVDTDYYAYWITGGTSFLNANGSTCGTVQTAVIMVHHISTKGDSFIKPSMTNKYYDLESKVDGVPLSFTSPGTQSFVIVSAVRFTSIHQTAGDWPAAVKSNEFFIAFL